MSDYISLPLGEFDYCSFRKFHYSLLSIEYSTKIEKVMGLYIHQK